MKAELCPHCGAKMKKYLHTLRSGALADILVKFQEKTGGRGNPGKIGITNYQYNNFQKLRYWNFVAREHHGGIWFVTPTGRSFVAGLITAPEVVITYRGVVVEEGQTQIKIHEAKGMGYLQREDYASQLN